MEVRRRARARGVSPVDTAQRCDVDRRLTFLHHADLPGRRVCAQQRVVVDVERVAMGARGMRERLVERVEVVPDRLDLAAVDDLVPQPEEDVLDLAPDLRQGMQAPPAQRCAGEGDVELLVELGQSAPLELGLTGCERSLEALTHGVQRHAGLSVADVPQADFEVALAAQPGGVGLGQLAGRGRFRKTLQSRARVLLPVHRANLAFEQLRRDSGAVRPVERQRRGGRRLLPRGGAPLGRAGRRARSRDGTDRGAARRRRDPRDRGRLLARRCSRCARAEPRSPASSSTCA